MRETVTIGPDRFAATMADVTRTGTRIVGVRIVGYAAGLGASVVIARALGPAGRGLYAFPLALLAVVMAVSTLGLEHANIYLAGKGVPVRDLWASGTRASVAIGATACIIVTSAYGLAGGDAFGGLPFLWIAVTVAQVPLLLQILYRSSALQLDGRAAVGATAAAMGAVVHAAVTLVLYANAMLTPFRVLILTAVANGTAWGWVTLAGHRLGLIGARSRWEDLRRALRFGVRAYGGLVFFFLLLRVDHLLVQRILGYRQLGLYALAVTLAELLWLVSDPFAVSVIAHQVRAAPGEERRLAFATARLGITFAGVASVVAWVSAPYAVRTLYGDGFEGAVTPFRLLLPGVVALAAYRPLATALLRQGRPMVATAFGLAALVGNVVANAVLLPSIGLVGAALSSSITYLGLAIAYVAVLGSPEVTWRDLIPRWSDVRAVRDSLRAPRG